MSTEMAHFDKVKEVIDLMMVMPIFGSTEKRKILGENNKTILNPNLIMDIRHEIFREPLSLSLKTKSVKDEAKRCEFYPYISRYFTSNDDPSFT